jgi:gliding motility-associated-like protein
MRNFTTTLLLIFTLFFTKTYSQGLNQGNCPNNIDFEFGNFTNWQCFISTVTPGPVYATFINSGPLNSRHNILNVLNSTGVIDPYGKFPVLCPNGSGYSVKLGNEGTARQAEKITYTFSVPIGSSKYSLTYYYAAVLNAPTHPDDQQARFTVSLKDILTNQNVGCSDYDYNSNTTNGGFVDSDVFFQGSNPPSLVKYKNWTPVTLDLSGLNGKTLKLEFLTNDCTQGAHFGYAYVDVGATCITPVTGFAYCTGQTSMTLTAPFGYAQYFWYDQNYTTTLGTGQTLTLSPPPPTGTILNIDLVPLPFGGCRDTLEVSVEEQTIPDTPVIASFFAYCQNQVTTQLQTTPAPGFIPNWYTSAVGGTPLGVPPTPVTTTIGFTDYYVSLQTFGGCEGPRKKVTVEVLAPPISNFTINDTIQCSVGNNFVFNSTSTNVTAASTYVWSYGDASPNGNGPTTNHIYANTGNYNVTLVVKNNTNCQATYSIPVSVTQTPLADFTTSPACAVTSFTFNNTTTGGSASNLYDWDFGNGLTSTQQNPVITLNNAGSITVKLKVTDGSCVHDTTKIVVVHPNPIPDFTPTNLCLGDVTSFINSTTLVSGNIVNWDWDFGGGNTSTSPNPNFTFVNSGLQTVKLTATSNNGCKRDTTKTFYINEKPTAKFVQVDTACLNAPVFLNDASTFVTNTNNSIVAQWWWSTGNGNTYTAPNISTNYNVAPNTFLVQQVVISDKGCVSDTNKQLINVKSLPIPNIDISTPLCFNRNITFTDLTPNSLSRNWILSNGFLSNQKTFNVNNLLAVPHTITLQLKDSFGCQSLWVNKNFTVNPRPIFAFSNLDSCLDRNVPFTAIDANGTYITKWVWNFEGNDIIGNANQAHLFSKSGLQKVSLYGVAANGCVSDTIVQKPFIYEAIANAGIDRLSAINEPIQLQASGGITYLWTPYFKITNDTIKNPIAKVDANQMYTVKVTSTQGCIDEDDMLITIYNGPDIYVPTIFTPNNDGTNDVLKINLVGIADFKGITIYNRAGNLVYQSKNETVSWDGNIKGKLADGGTYVWFANGIDFKGNNIIRKGTVVLAR